MIFSCKKDANHTTTDPIIDSVPTSPKWDSLPFPLTTGTWWKYQRYDSLLVTTSGLYTAKFDSSIELITVMGKTTLEKLNNQEAFFLTVKNLTKGTLDTNYAYYSNAHFTIKSSKSGTTFVNLTLPQVEGRFPYYDKTATYSALYVKKDTAVVLRNVKYDNCIYTNDDVLSGWPNSYVYQSIDFMKPNLGFVYWYMQSEQKSHYVSGNTWTVRKILDFYIAP